MCGCWVQLIQHNTTLLVCTTTPRMTHRLLVLDLFILALSLLDAFQLLSPLLTDTKQSSIQMKSCRCSGKMSSRSLARETFSSSPRRKPLPTIKPPKNSIQHRSYPQTALGGEVHLTHAALHRLRHVRLRLVPPAVHMCSSISISIIMHQHGSVSNEKDAVKNVPYVLMNILSCSVSSPR